MPLRPVQRRSASDAVFDQLIDELLGGEVRPGTTLPAERSLTGELQVSRQAVREALQRLAQAGLVEINHGGATKALDYRRNAGLALLPLLLTRRGDFDPSVARSVMEMRAAIGPDVARLCAERATPEVVERVTSLVEDMDATEDLTELANLDLDLWDALVDGCDNIAYRLAFNSLRATYEPILELVHPVFADELSDIAARRAIATAVATGDGDKAARSARQLLSQGSAAISAALVALQEGES